MSNSIPGLRPVLRTLPSVAASLTIVFGLATAESLIGGGHITPSTRSHENPVGMGPAVNPEIDTVRHEEHRHPVGQLACTLGGACFDPEATASSAGRGPTSFGMTPPRMTRLDFSRSEGPSGSGVPDADPIPVVVSVDPHFAPGGEHDGGAAGPLGAGGHGRGAGETQVVALLPGGNFPNLGGASGGTGGPGGGGHGSDDNGVARGGSSGGSAGGGGGGGSSGGGRGGGTNTKNDKSGNDAGGEHDDDAPTQLLRLAAAPDAVSDVPEPASAAILVLGLGGLALRRRR